MEKPSSINPAEHPEVDLLDHLEGTAHDPRAAALIRRALEMEKETNMVLIEDFPGMEELARRTSNHVRSLNKRWPYLGQPVTVSGWMIDHDAVAGSPDEFHAINGMDVTSNGFAYLPKIHQDEGLHKLQLRSVLQFEYSDGDERQLCYAVPNDVHIEGMYQSIDHANAILSEHYPEILRAIDDRIASIDPSNDIEVMRTFSDLLIPADPDPEIDTQMLEAVETYLRHKLELESSLPCFVVATGNYYQETYKKGEGAKVKKRTSSSVHDDLAFIDKITFRETIEEEKLRMHVPVLQVSVHTNNKDELPFIRQYPLHTIEDVMSLRSVSYKDVRRKGR